ncbi:MAG: pyridoxal phosphate-dependent aminotransferase [Alphaproteobacteria bacterium]
MTSRKDEITSFLAMDVYAEAQLLESQGHDIVHMEVGQPGTAAPRVVLDKAVNALKDDRIGYTNALGRDDLRARIAQHYQDQYGVDVAPDRIVITTGSSAGFVISFLSLFEAGDKVLLTQPGYPAYPNILRALNFEPSFLPIGFETAFRPDAQQVEAKIAAEGIKGFLLASPSNPTGTMVVGDDLAAVVEATQRAGATFLSDEIYHGLTYGQQADTALRYSDDAIVINSFSKYYAMTGWRIGWLVLPPQLVRMAERLSQNLYVAPPTLSQMAAMHAFDATPELEENRAVYAHNRQLLLNALPEIGFPNIAPCDGSFYIYIDVSDRTDDSAKFCSDMLREAHVGATPGADFDPTGGHKFIRLSFAESTDKIEEGIRRLRGWLQAR